MTREPIERPDEVVLYDLEGRCAVITINRPDARNAVSPEVARGLADAVGRAESDPEVRAMVITGTPPAFCAGADLKAIRDGRSDELSTVEGGFAGIVRYPRTKPLIAAVEGVALAGGTEIVLACDMVVAATSARFGIPEVKRGLAAGAGGLFRLGRRLPMNVAMEAALTGDPFDAEMAFRHGLVNSLVADGEAVDSALALARRVAANAPLALRESRAIVLECTFADDEEGWRRSAEAFSRLAESDDVREGVEAFLEKRDPVWRGR